MQERSLKQTRRAVLGLVLYEHPAELTSADLRREFGDAARQAVMDLHAAGLVKREGDYVRPSRPALNFYRLNLP